MPDPVLHTAEPFDSPKIEQADPPGFILLEDVLSLYGVDAANEDTLDRDAEALFIVNAPHQMPKEVQDFIQIQKERRLEDGMLIRAIPIAKLEADMPEGVQFKKLKKKDKSYIKRFLEQMEELSRIVCQTFDRAVEVKALYNAIHNGILAKLETLDDDVVAEIMPKVNQYHAELHDIKTTIVQHKETLRNAHRLDPGQVQAINEDLETKAEEINNIGRRFRTRLSNIMQRRKEEEERETHSPDLATKMKGQMNHASHDFNAALPRTGQRGYAASVFVCFCWGFGRSSRI